MDLGDDITSPDLKRQRLAAADESLNTVRFIGDAAVAAFFSADKDRAREQKREELAQRIADYLGRGDIAKRPTEEVQALKSGKFGVTPFHWEIEFPEVFSRENPGFDAIVGNPPFAGKNNLIGGHKDGYVDWIKSQHEGTHGNSDLVAHFFRRGFVLISNGGTLGLIATNTIAQGDTRTTGLSWIRKNNGYIYSAKRRAKWPGQAAVIVSILWISKGKELSTSILDGIEVPKITSYLFHAGGDESAQILSENIGKVFVGNVVLGPGFTFDDSDTSGEANTIEAYRQLVSENSQNLEVIFPYINGQEINSIPDHSPRRFVINFGSRSETEAEHWPKLLQIVREKVRPKRLQQASIVNPDRWWMFARSAADLYAAISKKTRVIARSLTSTNFQTFTFLPTGFVYDQTIIVCPFDSSGALSIVLSRAHEIWSLLQGGTMKDDPRYNVDDCFKTFPFPFQWESNEILKESGEAYYQFRANLMVCNNEGLTKTYNRFHDPEETSADIQKLRELHAAMDRAVLDAYGWNDIPTDCEFLLDYEEEESEEESSGRRKKKPYRYRWPDEVRDEVLARLLALNAERHAEEVRQAEEEAKLSGGTKKSPRGKKAQREKSADELL
jgi:hypothetical protein